MSLCARAVVNCSHRGWNVARAQGSLRCSCTLLGVDRVLGNQILLDYVTAYPSTLARHGVAVAATMGCAASRGVNPIDAALLQALIEAKRRRGDAQTLTFDELLLKFPKVCLTHIG